MNRKAQILYNVLGGSRAIYCNTCRYEQSDESDKCEDCHRKMIGWEISEETAENIIELLDKEN